MIRNIVMSPLGTKNLLAMQLRNTTQKEVIILSEYLSNICHCKDDDDYVGCSECSPAMQELTHSSAIIISEAPLSIFNNDEIIIVLKNSYEQWDRIISYCLNKARSGESWSARVEAAISWEIKVMRRAYSRDYQNAHCDEDILAICLLDALVEEEDNHNASNN